MPELTKLVTAIQSQINNATPAQQTPSDADKDNKQVKPAKWRSYTGLQWTPGMKYNPKWTNTQRSLYYNTFKEKDLEGWKNGGQKPCAPS